MAGMTREQAAEISRLRGVVGELVTEVAGDNEPDQMVEAHGIREALLDLSGSPRWEDLGMLAAVAVAMLAERKRADGYARPGR